MDSIAFDGFRVRVDLDRWPAKILRALLRRHYEKHELRLVRRFIRPGDRIMELGSAIGVVALAAGKLTAGANIACFDANPEMVAQATANFALNDTDARACQAVLVSDADTRQSVPFHRSPYFLGSSLMAQRTDSETIEVPTRALSAVLAGTDANILIVDIEGGESGLLDATDLSGIETLILEMHVSMLGTGACLDLIASLAGQGLLLDPVSTAYNVLVFRRGTRPENAGRVANGFARSYLSAIAHWEQGRSDAADHELRVASEICPENAFSRLLLSQIRAAGGATDETVLAEAEKAARLDPQNEDAFEHLAEIHARGGDLQQAQAAFARAIEITPCRPLFHAGLGTLMARQGRGREALGAFRAAVDLCPARTTSLGFTFALANRTDKFSGDSSDEDRVETTDERRFLTALAAATSSFRLHLAGHSLLHALELAPDDRRLACGLAALLATPRDVRTALAKSA